MFGPPHRCEGSPRFTLFDDLIGALQWRLRRCDAHYLRDFNVDDRLKLDRLVDRDVTRFHALQIRSGRIHWTVPKYWKSHDRLMNGRAARNEEAGANPAGAEMRKKAHFAP